MNGGKSKNDREKSTKAKSLYRSPENTLIIQLNLHILEIDENIEESIVE
jgi:hypothetical protein